MYICMYVFAITYLRLMTLFFKNKKVDIIYVHRRIDSHTKTRFKYKSALPTRYVISIYGRWLETFGSGSCAWLDVGETHFRAVFSKFRFTNRIWLHLNISNNNTVILEEFSLNYLLNKISFLDLKFVYILRDK